jgi:chromosome segregation ATPase
MMASLRDLNTRNGALTADLARLTTERDTLAARVTALETERVQIQAALTASNAENKSVEAGTTQALAALNIPRAELPAPASQGGGSKRERLESELAACTDPVQRGRLSVQIWDEMKSGGKN